VGGSTRSTEGFGSADRRRVECWVQPTLPASHSQERHCRGKVASAPLSPTISRKAGSKLIQAGHTAIRLVGFQWLARGTSRDSRGWAAAVARSGKPNSHSAFCSRMLRLREGLPLLANLDIHISRGRATLWTTLASPRASFLCNHCFGHQLRLFYSMWRTRLQKRRMWKSPQGPVTQT
jgi:hypothetical protein